MAEYTKTIIDVSEHQGGIDWGKAWASGAFDGVIIRTGYGDDLPEQDDKYAAFNLRECKKRGIPYATYLYSYAGTEKQIQSEIEHEKRVTAGYEPLYHILDLEEWSLRKNGMAAAKAWLKAFPENGIIYAGQAWWAGPLLGLNCRRWIPAYGFNSGKPETKYKPDYSMISWQYTSRGSVPGINGNVDKSLWYGPFGEADKTAAQERPAQKGRAVYKKEIACLLFIHLCTHNAHGYTMEMADRWGTGEETVDILGHKYTIKGGDRDCSSALINAFEAAGISCGGATYTGNMKKCMCGTGNFEVKPMSYTAQMADVYLNEANHTAMCISAEPDILGEFSINEKGKAYGGKQGDQKQVGEYDDALGRGESHLRAYYDYPWDFILRCKNEEIAFYVEGDEQPQQAAQEPVRPQEDGKTETTAGDATEPSTGTLAALTILGTYGNSKARREALGGRYEAVQAAVNTALIKHKDGLVEAMGTFIDTII